MIIFWFVDHEEGNITNANILKIYFNIEISEESGGEEIFWWWVGYEGDKYRGVSEALLRQKGTNFTN